MKKTAVVVHVFYSELWPELAQCIRNISDPFDVFVTAVDGSMEATVKRDFPEARFVLCENRGYDVWPFIRVLRDLPAEDYDWVVKLHTKRDVFDGFRYRFNHAVFNGPAWRNYLLSFLKTPTAWRRTRHLLEKHGVGMVADRHIVMRRQDVPFERTQESFDRAAALMGLSAETKANGQYVAGTMFAARITALAPLLRLNLMAEDFEPPQGHLTETFAHIMERAIGLAVSAAGFRIVAWNGSLGLRRFFFHFRPGRP